MKTVRFLFSDQMARAIVEGRKTVTRRPGDVECAAHHAPQGTQALLPLDEGHGVERRPRDVSADPLPW